MASFAELSSAKDSPVLKIAEERIAHLEYFLKQEEYSNAKLTGDLASTEELLQESRDIVDRREDELQKAQQKIQDLEKRWLEAEKDCRQVRDSMNRLEKTLGVHRGDSATIDISEKKLLEGFPPQSEAVSYIKLLDRINLQEEKLKEGCKALEAETRRANAAETDVQLAKQREIRFTRRGTKILQLACKSAFSAGFERCKKHVEPLLPADNNVQLIVDSEDVVLKAVFEDSAKILHKIVHPDCLNSAHTVDRSIQTDDNPEESSL